MTVEMDGMGAIAMGTRRLGVCGLALLLMACGSVASGAEAHVADAAETLDRLRLRALLERHADANQAQADGMTALHWAA